MKRAVAVKKKQTVLRRSAPVSRFKLWQIAGEGLAKTRDALRKMDAVDRFMAIRS